MLQEPQKSGSPYQTFHVMAYSLNSLKGDIWGTRKVSITGFFSGGYYEFRLELTWLKGLVYLLGDDLNRSSACRTWFQGHCHREP